MSEFRINTVLQGSYKYGAMGRQAIRTLTSPTPVTIHSVFDSDGRRIAEYNETSGALIREYVWNGWDPIAVIEGGVISFVRADHIGRPVFATNASGVKVWTATYQPFGGVHTSTGALPTARFPGQWFQSESGLHQNWMRDYDPTTGRYLQADPLGLVDGASVYGYVRQSPMMLTDPTGECPWCIPAAIFAVGLLYDILTDEDGCIEYHELAYYVFSNATGWKWAKWAARAAGAGGGGQRPFGAGHNSGFNGKYEANPKHKQKRPGVSPEPKNPTEVLPNSVPIGGNSTARIGYDPKTGEIIIFRPHGENTYHGYATDWGSLSQSQRNALIDSGAFSPGGRPLL
jgi:RHS repeat-associated protein